MHEMPQILSQNPETLATDISLCVCVCLHEILRNTFTTFQQISQTS